MLESSLWKNDGMGQTCVGLREKEHNLPVGRVETHTHTNTPLPLVVLFLHLFQQKKISRLLPLCSPALAPAFPKDRLERTERKGCEIDVESERLFHPPLPGLPVAIGYLIYTPLPLR